MKKCIICEEPKQDTEFNIEHIIPEALGNKELTISDVCTSCNGKLGYRVDAYLTDVFLSKIYRFHEGLKGKKGKIPNPFKTGGTTIDGKKVIVDDSLKPSFLPEIDVELRDGNIHIKGHCSNKKEFVSIVNKKLVRMGLSPLSDDQISKAMVNKKVTLESPTIEYPFLLELNKINLGLIKIGYEFAYRIGGTDYLKDKVAKELRSILNGYINGADYVATTSSNYVQQAPDNFSIIRETSKHLYLPNITSKHILLLTKIQNASVLIVDLESLPMHWVKIAEATNSLFNRVKAMSST